MKDKVIRYIKIITKLKENPASFNEIAEYLRNASMSIDYDLNISTRTFQRDIKDILSIFELEIKYDSSEKVYKICYESIENYNRILDLFDIVNILNVNDFAEYILFENRRHGRTKYLHTILQAIKNQVQIVFTYQKYWDGDLSERTVDPYIIKEFNLRWYLVAKDSCDNRIKSFALDRLSRINVTKKKIIMPNNFNAKSYYANCFGVIGPNAEQPMEVILSFTPFQGKYIKSRKLHSSQEILADNDDEFIIKLTLFITHDFFMELLSFGENVKIIEPSSLINDIKMSLQKTLEQY